MRRIIFFAAALMLTLSVTAQNKMLSSKQLIPARPKPVSPSGR